MLGSLGWKSYGRKIDGRNIRSKKREPQIAQIDADKNAGREVRTRLDISSCRG
jgi:hypothetical protein